MTNKKKGPIAVAEITPEKGKSNSESGDEIIQRRSGRRKQIADSPVKDSVSTTKKRKLSEMDLLSNETPSKSKRFKSSETLVLPAS